MVYLLKMVIFHSFLYVYQRVTCDVWCKQFRHQVGPIICVKGYLKFAASPSGAEFITALKKHATIRVDLRMSNVLIFLDQAENSSNPITTIPDYAGMKKGLTNTHHLGVMTSWGSTPKKSNATGWQSQVRHDHVRPDTFVLAYFGFVYKECQRRIFINLSANRDFHNNFWLVVSTPLKKVGQLGVLFPLFPLMEKTCSKPPTSWEDGDLHRFSLWKVQTFHQWEISRILKWRYVSTIFLAIFCWDIPANIGLKKGPKIYGIGTSNGSRFQLNSHWLYNIPMINNH